MSHSAKSGGAKNLVRNSACSTCTAADISSPCTGHCTVNTLSTTGTEFQHSAAFRGAANAVCLGGDKTLVVELQQQIGLNELGLNGGSTDNNGGLHREDGSSFGDSPYITCKFEVCKIIEETLREKISASQIFYIFCLKMQILDIVDDLFQTGTDSVSTFIGNAAVEDIKIAHGILHIFCKITIAHGQLVKITEHGKINSVRTIHVSFSYRFMPH